MPVISIFLRYRLPRNSQTRMFEASVTTAQYVALKEVDSPIWTQLQNAAMEKLNLDEPGLFGRIILDERTAKKQRQPILEIDITGPAKLEAGVTKQIKQKARWLKKSLRRISPEWLRKRNA